MPEYLAPGVYVEEVSFRAKSIEGVPTSTTGFAGLTRYGPVQYTFNNAAGPTVTEPRLITSFTEFERVYGGLEPLSLDQSTDGTPDRPVFLAHAARAFFLNGGKRLYVSRVFASRGQNGDDPGIASRAVPLPGGNATVLWRARWPGAAGQVFVTTQVTRSKNIALPDPRFNDAVQARSVRDGAVVEILFPVPEKLPTLNDPLDANTLAVVRIGPDGRQTFMRGANEVTVDPGAVIQLVELRVIVQVNSERQDVYSALGADRGQRRYIGTILDLDHPEDDDAVVALQLDDAAGANENQFPIDLMVGLQSSGPVRLSGGHDGTMPSPDDFLGREADPDDAAVKATGLEALGEIDDIAIVALPDGSTYSGDDAEELCFVAAQNLIDHAQRERYRIAIVDAPEGSSISEVRRFRGRFDSTYAALYHPWIEVFNPLERLTQGAPPSRLRLPPSGFVAGIYARSDIERGVFKAPANEVVFGLTQFEANINKARQEVLNPEGINALRFFPGRGNRVWGARTMSSDPEWRYVNVRRLFIYLEHSIDKSTQFAVFEPNNPRLWANIQRTVEDFLLVQWRDGALFGATPEEAFFVRCDRTTMTQNDLDNGRLIVLIGVAPTRPAEFVIFRIGQFTADARTS